MFFDGIHSCMDLCYTIFIYYVNMIPLLLNKLLNLESFHDLL